MRKIMIAATALSAAMSLGALQRANALPFLPTSGATVAMPAGHAFPVRPRQPAERPAPSPARGVQSHGQPVRGHESDPRAAATRATPERDGYAQSNHRKDVSNTADHGAASGVRGIPSRVPVYQPTHQPVGTSGRQPVNQPRRGASSTTRSGDRNTGRNTGRPDRG